MIVFCRRIYGKKAKGRFATLYRLLRVPLTILKDLLRRLTILTRGRQGIHQFVEIMNDGHELSCVF